LLFENYGQEVGDQYIVGPQAKSSGGPVSPCPYVCCTYVRECESGLYFSFLWHRRCHPWKPHYKPRHIQQW